MTPTFSASLRRVAALAGLLLTSACSSNVTAPTTWIPEPTAANGLSSADLAEALESLKAYFSTTILSRATELANDITVTKTIDAAGGTVSIPSIGFELVVPKGAVKKKTVFSVTALAGKSIAFEFEPHGVTFKQPLTFRQNAAYTAGWWNATAGGYFSSRDQVDTKSGKANVAEVVPMVWDGFWLTFQIQHFSGYLVSCA
jgi:hypothetical protein